jgi:hypothetical protein
MLLKTLQKKKKNVKKKIVKILRACEKFDRLFHLLFFSI